MFELLFTPDALALLVRRIEAVNKEIGDISMLYNYRAGAMMISEFKGTDLADHDAQSLEADVPRFAARLRRHQKQRLSLPPLPAFPREPRDRPV